MKTWRTVLGAALVWLLAAGTGWAQAVAGSQVSGVVKDSSGGVLPGVEVTITKTDTGTARTVFTGADGAYVFPNLPVGPYRLKVVLQGFNTYVQEGIVLQVNTNPTIDVALAVGQHRRAGHRHRERRRPSKPGPPASARSSTTSRSRRSR